MTQDSPPSPEQAAAQLSIYRYAVTLPTQEAHDKLAAAAPWANWAERLSRAEIPGRPAEITWLVTVFAVDNDAFLTIIGSDVHQKTVVEVWGDQEEGGIVMTWAPPPDFWVPQSSNGHG
jgi:hypothetical protein